MIDLNRFTISGNLASDPKTLPVNETTVTKGRIIHSKSYKDKDSQEWKKTEPVAFDFEIWDGYGKVFQEKVTKGSEVILEGHFRANNYMKDGEMVYAAPVLRIDVWHLVPVGPRQKSEG